MIHGIVGNNWYDREKNKSIYCTDDSNYDNIGGDDYSGNKSPNNLLVETFADINKYYNPNAKTISVRTNKKIKFNLLYDENTSLQKKIKLEQIRKETN